MDEFSAKEHKISAAESSPPERQSVSFLINGLKFRGDVEPRAILLDTIRDDLGFTGAKKGCDHGQCGACTALVDGRRVNTCLMLTVMADGAQITTIEGLSVGDKLHPAQQAFIDHDAFQCGYCTSGQILSAVALQDEPIGHDDASLCEAMSGNICRCGAYRNILLAVKEARGAQR